MNRNNNYYDITPNYPKQINKKMNKMYEIDLYDEQYNVPCFYDNCNGRFIPFLEWSNHCDKYHNKKKCCVIL
jgi:hypothetical protein